MDAVELLTCRGKFRVKLGLERISRVLEKLDNPQDKLKCIHVAGTNGKGSVCAIISAVLNEAGYKAGLYTSPHIFDYRERIQINGEMISKEDFENYVEEICGLCDDLTEFEILTAVMFKYFADKNVDVVVLETGLGGRYDATNVIKSNLCAVITHIDYDHTERLGHTLAQIAFEKAGIIKENCPVIISQGFEVVKARADEKNALFVLVSPCENTQNLSLKGLYQQENLSLALSAVRLVFPEISEAAIQSALTKVQHPCRFQYIKEKNMIIDAAHNPNGIKALCESLKYFYSDKFIRIIFGCLKNKDYKTMLGELSKVSDEIYYYHFDYPNSATVKELQEAYFANEYKQKFDYTDGKLTVVCGSFYMLKELSKKL